MNKKLKQDIRDSFNFPDAKHKYEFLTQAEVASAQEEKRKHTIPVVFRVTAAAAAAALAIGLWTNLRSHPDPSGGDFRDGSVIVTETVSAQPVTTSYTNDNGTTVTAVPTATSYNSTVNHQTTATGTVETVTSYADTSNAGRTSTSAVQADQSYAGADTAIVTSPALGVTTQSSANRTTESRTTAAVTTNIPMTTTTVNKEIERSFEMKKIAAFLSALSISAAALPMNSNASSGIKVGVEDYMFNTDFDASKYYTEPPFGYSYNSEMKMFDNGQLISDIDGNGVFDRMDPYLVYKCFNDDKYGSNIPLSDELSTFIRENCDYNRDGGFDRWDAEIIIAYYILNNRPTWADLDWNSYDPTYVPQRYQTASPINVTNISCELMYVYEFDSMLTMLGQARTYITSEFIEDGTIDLDVNEDGVVDIKDAACFAVYYRNGDPVYYVLNEDGDYVRTKITKRIDLPDKINKKIKKYCDAAMPERNQHSTYTHDDDRCLEIIEYFVMHYPLKECYFEDEYYDTVLSTDTSQYGLGEILTFSAKNRQVIIPRGDTERFQFYQDVFEEQFTAYYQNVLDGKQPIPDINGDGVADTEDYTAAGEYMNAFFRNETIETTSIPIDIFEKFTTDCDFNQNGISGDIYDIMITQIYIMYIDAYHPEEIVDSNEQFSYQSNISILNAMDIQRSGDANCDGETDLADAIFIMQSMANPDKYNISERGRFNGDVYETGHGITANDALEIQNTLLHKDN